MGEKERAARVEWGGMQSPYAGTAYERDYWAPDSAEESFVRSQLQDVAQRYNIRGGQVASELADQGVGTTGTIGQFAKAYQVNMPRAQEESGIRQNQYNRRWTGEQTQYGRQGDYTTQLNDLAMKKALAEQSAKLSQYESGRQRKLAREQAGAEATSNVLNQAGRLSAAYFTGGAS